MKIVLFNYCTSGRKVVLYGHGWLKFTKLSFIEAYTRLSLHRSQYIVSKHVWSTIHKE